MSKQPSLLATAATPLYLYRHILRECSYLPPAFRTTITTIIRDRFRRNIEQDTLTAKRTKRANNVLRTIRAANNGDRIAMISLIDKAFGRTGPRRRELMGAFVRPQGPSDSAELEAALASLEPSDPSKPPQNAKSKGFLNKWDTKKLLKLLESQRRKQGHTRTMIGWAGSPIKSTNPDSLIPELTPWMTKPSESLVNAKRAKWWRRNIEKIMPPLGEGEWDLLSKLTNDLQVHDASWQVPPRRAGAVAPLTNSSSTGSWQEYAVGTASAIEKNKRGDALRRSGQTDNSPYSPRLRRGAFSPRWFRRAYDRTWQRTPVMDQDPNTLGYKFRWGEGKLRIAEPSTKQLEFFSIPEPDKKGKR